MRTIPKGKELRTPEPSEACGRALAGHRATQQTTFLTRPGEAPASRSSQGTPDTEIRGQRGSPPFVEEDPKSSG